MARVPHSPEILQPKHLHLHSEPTHSVVCSSTHQCEALAKIRDLHDEVAALNFENRMLHKRTRALSAAVARGDSMRGSSLYWSSTWPDTSWTWNGAGDWNDSSPERNSWSWRPNTWNRRSSSRSLSKSRNADQNKTKTRSSNKESAHGSKSDSRALNSDGYVRWWEKTWSEEWCSRNDAQMPESLGGRWSERSDWDWWKQNHAGVESFIGNDAREEFYSWRRSMGAGVWQ